MHATYYSIASVLSVHVSTEVSSVFLTANYNEARLIQHFNYNLRGRSWLSSYKMGYVRKNRQSLILNLFVGLQNNNFSISFCNCVPGLCHCMDRNIYNTCKLFTTLIHYPSVSRYPCDKVYIA